MVPERKMIKFILCCLLVFFTISGLAQSPYFKNYIINKENPGTSVNVVFEDRSGFIWLGTRSGLYRYNGFEFQNFNDTTEEKSEVTAIAEDKDGKIWIGYQNGKIKYLLKGKFYSFQPEEGLPKQSITGIIFDKQGHMWFSTYGEGLYVYNNQYTYNFNTDDGMVDNFIYAIILDSKEQIWAGTDGGISICTFSNIEKGIKNITVEEGLPDNIVLSFAKDNKGIIYAGLYDKGYCRINERSLKIESTGVQNWEYGPVSSILPFASDDLWIGTTGSGIIELNEKQGNSIQVYKNFKGYTNARIEELIKDSEGNIWIGTNTDGLFSADKKLKFLSGINGKGLENIYAILYDSKGDLWFSTRNGLVHYFLDKEKQPLERHIVGSGTGEEIIISIYEDKYGYIWLGTFGNGLYRLNPQNYQFKRITEQDGLVNNNILSITGKDGEIWFATLGGVSSLKLPENAQDPLKLNFRNYSEAHGLGSNYIYKVFIDSKNREWFATDGRGITVLENNKFKTFNRQNGLKSEIIYSITEDKEGNIWFSTSDAGIYKFDGKNFTNYSLEDGLRSLSISALATDAKGNIVIIHDSGLDVLNPETENVLYYGEANGLSNIDPDLNAITYDPFGDIWVGTRKGIIKYSNYDEKLKTRPQTIINKVMISLNEIDTLEKKFHYHDNHIAFEYIGLWFHNPENVFYQHMLEGYDLDWIPSRDRMASYSNLSPGSYTFRVRSSTNTNFANADEETFSFVIQPPFWKTSWFIILCIVLAGIIIYVIIKVREARVQKVERLEKDKITFQFETLKNQVNPHFLFNSFNTLMTIIEEDQKLAGEYVEKLSDFFRNILTFREKDLIPLREELNLIDDYYFLQQKRFSENLTMKVDVGMDQLDDLIPPLTLQLLVENAIKHNVISKNKPLNIEVYSLDGYIYVKNNLQRKKVPESSTGVGLQNIYNRFAILSKKKVKIIENDTEYLVAVPLIKSEK